MVWGGIRLQCAAAVMRMFASELHDYLQLAPLLALLPTSTSVLQQRNAPCERSAGAHAEAGHLQPQEVIAREVVLQRQAADDGGALPRAAPRPVAPRCPHCHSVLHRQRGKAGCAKAVGTTCA